MSAKQRKAQRTNRLLDDATSPVGDEEQDEEDDNDDDWNDEQSVEVVVGRTPFNGRLTVDTAALAVELARQMHVAHVTCRTRRVRARSAVCRTPQRHIRQSVM